MHATNNRLLGKRDRFVLEQLEDRVVLSAEPLVLPAFEGFLYPLGSETVESVSANAEALHGDAYNLPQAHQSFPYRGEGYTIAVIDSGIDYDHPALGGGFGPGARVIGGRDFVDGRDGRYVEGDSKPGPDDDPMDHYGHGTMVAGIIAADDDDYRGIAPEANLVSLRVLDANGEGDVNWLKQALQWVDDHREQYNIVAVNMSVGIGNYDGPVARDLLTPELESLTDNGVFIAGAAGNHFYSYASQPGLAYPAVNSHVVSVGAVYDSVGGNFNWSDGAKDYSTAADRIASFSQRSSDLDIMAPGAVVTSTQLSHGGQNNFGTYYGTSLAAAMVTGSATLMREAAETVGRPDLAAPNQILQIMQHTGVTVVDGDDEQDNVVNTGLSFQRLDLHGAIEFIQRMDAHAPRQGGHMPTEQEQEQPEESGGLPQVSTPVEQLAPDRFESNETMSAAARLGWIKNEAYFDDLTLHDAQDVDWYMFASDYAGSHRIIVESPVSDGQVQMAVHSIIRGNEMTLTADVVDGVASVDVNLRDKAFYFIEVHSTGERSAAYTLRISNDIFGPPSSPIPPEEPTEPEPEPTEPGEPTGAPDRFESYGNDEFGRASFLGKLSGAVVDELTLHDSDDVDYYRFQSEGRRYRIELETLAGSATFTFMDVTKNRERTVVATSTENGAALEIELRAGVNYFLKVESVDGHPADYLLRFA